MPGIKPKSLFELKKLPKQRRSKATVEAILEAATQLLLEIGYDKTRVLFPTPLAICFDYISLPMLILYAQT